MIYEVKDINQYKDICKDLLSRHNPPLVLLLTGELGSGKTTFTKELGDILGVDNVVKSPTFIIHQEYISSKSKIVMHHYDFYRLVSEIELKELLIENLIKPNSYIVIEWADKFIEILNELFKNIDMIHINFTHKSEFIRIVEVNE